MTATADQLNAALAAATGGASLPYLDMRVVFDDGRELFSHADQRDMRRAQLMCGISDPAADPLGFNRATAWSYLARTGQLDGLGWSAFDAEVAFVIPAEQQTTADPTRPATAG
jgi:hypothetical protein